MNNLTTFNYLSNSVRVIEIDGNPWFVASDVCRVLSIHIRADGSVNTSNALSKLPTDEKQNLPYKDAHRMGLQLIASRAYGVSIISESGLYRLTMRSDKPEARQFQDWVTREVLPAIRKDGMYVVGEEKVSVVPLRPVSICACL